MQPDLPSKCQGKARVCQRSTTSDASGARLQNHLQNDIRISVTGYGCIALAALIPKSKIYLRMNCFYFSSLSFLSSVISRGRSSGQASGRTILT